MPTSSPLLAPHVIDATPRLSRTSLRSIVLVAAIPLAFFVLHASLFGAWIVDDAGISFAYSRSLAAGYGLVSQPGVSPVEGYTNFLWVVLMAGFFRLGLFHVVWTPKIVACLLTAGSFLLVTSALKRHGPWGFAVPVSALTLVALQPAFAIWSISGLENPLYVFLACLLMTIVVRSLADTTPSRRRIVVMGLVSAGIVATRPDGLVYIPVVLVTLLARVYMARSRAAWLAACGLYGVVTATLLAAQFAFRWWYFSDVFPNTYYMKGVGGMTSMGSVLWLVPDVIAKIRGLAEAVAGNRASIWFLIAVFAATVFLIGRRQFSALLAVLAAFCLVSALSYLLLPLDWMGEFRFASPFFVFCYLYIAALAWTLCASIARDPQLRRRSFALAMSLLIVATLPHAARRSVAFANALTVPLAAVAEYSGHAYNQVAAALGLGSASLLAPDLGGALLYSNLLVFDLAGLCDRTIARTIGRDPRSFHDYVFERIRPTFIHLHSTYWADLASLDSDARFRRDYVPIRERTTYEHGVPRLQYGDWVRRDALHGPVDQRIAAILDRATWFNEWSR